MFKLTKYLKGYRGVSVIGAFFKLCEAIFELIVPVIMADIIDVGIKNGDVSYILGRGGVLIALGVSGLVLALICQYLASRSAQGFGTSLRRDLYHHINSLSFLEVDAIGAGSLITRLTGDIYQAEKAVAMTIRLASRVPFLIIGSVIMAVILDWKLAIIFAILAPAIGLVLYLIMKKSVPYYKKNQEKLDELNLLTNENLGGARVIRAYANEDEEIEEFGNKANELKDNAVKVGRIANLLNPLTTVILNSGIIAIIYFGGLQVNAGALTQGEVIAFINYVSQIMLAIIVFSQLIAIYTKAGASAERINELFNIKSSVIDARECGETEKIEQISGVNAEITGEKPTPLIRFDRVSFSYGGEPAVSNASFDIERGDLIGIIGGTGSGKSTLINLIPRFYDPTEGGIFYNGENLKNIGIKKLRARIGLVPQKATLFRGTIAENVRWGKPDAADKEVKEACALAIADEFIEAIPLRYDAAVSSNAKNLSGGQIQRITIARALIRKPELLILDDSSSALDYATDYKLRRNIRRLNTTAIIVSQRVSSIKDADKIIVMDSGKIVGIGKHEDLLRRSDEYREMYMSQGGKEAENG